MSGKFPGGFVTTGAPAGFSVAFDGTGDYLSVANNAAFAPGSGDFTAECWINSTTNSNAGGGTCLIGHITSGGATNTNWALYKDLPAAGNVGFYASDGTTYQINGIGGGSVNDGIWHHVAVTRSGSSFKVFVDGVQVGSTGTWAGTISSTSRPLQIGYNGSAAYMTGYISNSRFVKGTALYTATFTPPTQLFPITNTSLLTCQSPTIVDNSINNFTITANGNAAPSTFTPFTGYTAGASGFKPALGAAAPGVWTLEEATNYQGNRQWPIYDPYFNQTTLMLHGNYRGTVDSTGAAVYQNNTFLDSSTNNFPITRFANTTQGTFTPFSQTGWSNYFDGTGDYLTTPSNAAFDFWAGSFTFETWFYPTGNLSNSVLFSTGSSTTGVQLGFSNNTQVYSNVSPASTLISGSAPTLNAWNHIVLTKSGSTFALFLNGTRLGTSTSTAYPTGNQSAFIGANSANNSQVIIGYVSNVRLVKGTAVYNPSLTTLTVPTIPLTAISGTSLLTAQDNRFVDDSANNFTITVNGNPSVQAFSPFVPTVTTPTTYSNWFNGSTGYLTVPSNAALQITNVDWTVEAWVNLTTLPSASNYQAIVQKGRGAANDYEYFIAINNNAGNYRLYVELSTTGTNVVGYNSSNITLLASTWNHFAVSKSGTTLYYFVNGVAAGTSTITSATGWYTGSSTLGIGANNNGGAYLLNGVMSNLRILKGTALYTANFTPPTAPLTNITNTSLLTCQNSTFIDNSTANGGVGFTITANGAVYPVASPTPFPAKVDQTTLNTAYSTSLIGGSGYFDGTGDYLTATYPINWSTYGSYTLEFWFYAPTIAANNFGFVSTGSTGYTNFYMYGSSGTNPGAIAIGIQGTNELKSANSVIAANTWYHIAYTYDGTTTRIFVNGVSVASGTTAVYSNNSANLVIGNGLSNNYTLGYISGLRLIQGTALYTQNFAPPVLPPTSTGSQTKLLLNYTNAGIIDNTAKNVLETVGGAQISTAQSKWGGSSMYFDGTGDRLVNLVSSPSYGLANSDYTVECWVYPNSFSTTPYIISAANGNTSTNWALYITTGGALGWGGNTGVNQFSAGTISTSTWTHIAISQSGTNVYWFINGVLVLTKTKTDINNASWVSTSTISIGSSYGTNEYNGYIDDLRITKGVARYTANFTPPTSQLQDQ